MNYHLTNLVLVIVNGAAARRRPPPERGESVCTRSSRTFIFSLLTQRPIRRSLFYFMYVNRLKHSIAIISTIKETTLIFRKPTKQT